MEELELHRRRGMVILAGVCLFLALIVLVGAMWSAAGFLPVALAVAAATGPVMLTLQGRADAGARIVTGSAVAIFPMILLYQWSGSAWMLDLHMTFFAALAVLAVLADWRPVLTGAGLTAVHHLVTNFVAPSLVYPNGADFGRVMLHAVIVIGETGALVYVCRQIEALILRQAEAQVARGKVEAGAAAERARIEHEQKQVIDAIAARLDSLAAGNLSDRILVHFPAASEHLRDCFNLAMDDLDRMVAQVLEVAGRITTGSTEIRAASDDLARRTETQASSLEQNGATTRSLTARIESTANCAGDVNRSIIAAQDDAVAGGEVVERAIQAMSGIEKSSSEIAQIVTIIDGIAFQTNLLALNAGVEAARAGDAGRGFAVVASEVRALAQRSADAARDIKALIGASTSQVNEGVSLVQETGTVLRAIVDQVTGIGGAIRTIAEDARVQAESLHAVNRNFSQIDQVTQQNAAMVEENNAAAHNLQRDADTLSSLVQRFHTSGDPAAPNNRTRLARAA